MVVQESDAREAGLEIQLSDGGRKDERRISAAKREMANLFRQHWVLSEGCMEMEKENCWRQAEKLRTRIRPTTNGSYFGGVS